MTAWLQFTIFCKLDAEGGELLRSDISYIAEGRENTYINDMMTDGKETYISRTSISVYMFLMTRN